MQQMILDILCSPIIFVLPEAWSYCQSVGMYCAVLCRHVNKDPRVEKMNGVARQKVLPRITAKRQLVTALVAGYEDTR